MFMVHKIRLDPSDRTKTRLLQHIGFARIAFNHALRDFKDGLNVGEFRNHLELLRRFNAEKHKLYPWCSELSSLASKHAIRHLGHAVRRRFGKKKDGSAWKRQGRFPRFRKRGKHDSYQADNGVGTVRAEGKRVLLPKIGWVKMREEVRFPGEIRQCSISRRGDKWFASLMLEVPNPPPPEKTAEVVGVDLGVKMLAVCSDGVKYSNPKPLGAELKKLRRLNRSLSRREKTSKRRAAMRLRISNLHYRISCLRHDSAHQASTAIAKRARKVVAETLNVEGMLKNRHLALSVGDAGLGNFLRLLEYKCERYGAEFQQVSRWFPSSRLCSHCGWRNPDLTLSMREWECGGCHRRLDRDENAARNLEHAGGSSVSARVGPVQSGLNAEASVVPSGAISAAREPRIGLGSS